MSGRIAMPPKKQSRRVAAWIYTVINPIISSLEREISFLDSGNLTWRAYSRRCEMIKTIKEYVDPTQWPNYDDFLAEHSKSAFVPGFRRHDSDLEALNNAALALFGRLLSLPDFLSSLDASLANYESQRASLSPQAPSLIHTVKDVREEATQHVINNVQKLPSHYVVSHFWNEVGSNLLSFRNRPEFQPLHKTTNVLLEISAKLKQALESHRLTLSRRHDVPAAPVPGLSIEE